MGGEDEWCFLIEQEHFHIFTNAVLELKFCMEVQEEGMGLEEEFIQQILITDKVKSVDKSIGKSIIN